MVAAKAREAGASAPVGSALAGLSQDEIVRLVTKAKAAEEQEAARSLGKKEKAGLARAGRALLVREAKDARKAAGKPVTPTVAECRAWQKAHPPTPKKTK